MDTPDQNGGNELSEQKPRSRANWRQEPNALRCVFARLQI